MPELTDELLYIAARYTKKIREAILQSHKEFLLRVSERDVLNALKENGLQGLVELAESIGGDIARNVTPLLTDAWRDSGRAVLTLLPSGSLIGSVVFDSLPVGAVSAAEAYRAALVQDLTDSAREVVTQSVSANIIAGNNPRKTARDFRGVIGLSAQQELAVRNYRNYLETLNPEALRRSLRDARSDRTVARAIQDGVPLTEQQIESLVERYRQRSLKYRSEMIARVEAMRAVNMGEYESLLTAFNEGKLNKNLRRFWVVTEDERLRDAHRPIPEINKYGVAVNEYFVTPLGPMRYPLDPDGVAANVIHCRCRVAYRIVDNSTLYARQAPYRGFLPRDINDVVSYPPRGGN